MKRIWQVGPGGLAPLQTVEGLRQLLLRQRGITTEVAEHFFNPRYDEVIHDPLLLPDMAVAVERIYRAVANKEHIVVYGDYDADGISSTAILVTALRELDAAVTPYLPHRVDDGYGLSRTALERLAPEMQLLITVDCGISNAAEIAFLRERGIDTIVVDHHTIPDELPPALAIVHPRLPRAVPSRSPGRRGEASAKWGHPQHPYPSPWLCGAGLAWKVAQALYRDPRSPNHRDGDREKWLLDLAVIGTVADVVPLTGENRAIVRFGLEVLKRTPRPGLRACLQALRLNVAHLSAEDIAFRLVPRLNAAGRMDHPQPALDLLLAATEAEADALLRHLNQLNQLRQTLTRRVMREAEAQLGAADLPFVFAHSEEWPAGVVGLAAGRLADRFNRPAIVVGRNGANAVGSARSPAHVNVLELLRAGEEHLLKLGGHTQAAGFTVAEGSIEAFQEALHDFAGAAAWSHSGPAGRVHRADAVVEAPLIDRQVVELIRRFAPFGEGNKQPVFVLRDLAVLDCRAVGKESQHAKFTFHHTYDALEGIGFNIDETQRQAALAAKRVDVLGALEENEFRGRTSLQLNIKDIAPVGTITISEQAP